MSPSAKLPDLREGEPLPKEYLPDVSNLVTEDDTPVDNFYAEKQQRLLTESLYASWNPGEPFVAMANVGLFYQAQTPAIVPDVLYSLGVSAPADPFPKEHRSYFTWMYGKPPDAIIESVSNREGGEDTRKLSVYATVRVSYYAIWDPECHLSPERLRLYILQEGVYVPMAGTLLKRLGLGLAIWHGVYEDLEADWLRWCDADGNLILTGLERAHAAELRAQDADQRAQNADQRAQNAETRAERLAAKLRALGVDPNGGS